MHRVGAWLALWAMCTPCWQPMPNSKAPLTACLLGVGDGAHRLDAGAAQAPRLEVALCRCRVGKQRAVKSGLLSSLCTAPLDASVQLAVLHWEALKAATPPPQLPAAHP